MLARNFLLLSLLLIFVTPIVSSKSCPQYCAVCSVEKAICEIDDTDPFPLNLDPETKRLSITYIGEKGFRLNASTVNRYQRLQELALTGNVSSIEAKAFAKQDHLTISLQYSSPWSSGFIIMSLVIYQTHPIFVYWNSTTTVWWDCYQLMYFQVYPTWKLWTYLTTLSKCVTETTLSAVPSRIWETWKDWTWPGWEMQSSVKT